LTSVDYDCWRCHPRSLDSLEQDLSQAGREK
jgi:hypothetical protein